MEGKEVYTRRCADCHGSEGQGGDQGEALVGGEGTLDTPKPVKTVGSYWPYATTLWDYINRAMPFDSPGSLTHKQVYALVAYLLYLNGIIEEEEVIDAQTLPQVRMPNREGFVPDPRPDVGTTDQSEKNYDLISGPRFCEWSSRPRRVFESDRFPEPPPGRHRQ